uniref:Uncharacterized protein n=1 Tax=Tetradesmus obliquus TaxID=3088 RepID=A0A383WD79_TETOB|eukprot:jgi/Sobl393_1/15274/SZX75142.1
MLAVLGRRAAAAAGLLPGLAQQAGRCINTSQPAADLRNFLDEADPMLAAHGRAWLARELRTKSWDDLHRLCERASLEADAVKAADMKRVLHYM